MVVERPTTYYGDDQPELIEFIPRRPPGYDDMSLEEVVAHFENLLREAENEIHREMKKKKRRFLGVKGVLATDPSSRPKRKRGRAKGPRRFRAFHPSFLSRACAANAPLRA